jgi:hypothetical protein
MDCLSQIIKNEGPISLYKGSLFPLLLVGSASSVQFGVNEKMKNYVGKENFG